MKLGCFMIGRFSYTRTDSKLPGLSLIFCEISKGVRGSSWDCSIAHGHGDGVLASGTTEYLLIWFEELPSWTHVIIFHGQFTLSLSPSCIHYICSGSRELRSECWPKHLLYITACTCPSFLLSITHLATTSILVVQTISSSCTISNQPANASECIEHYHAGELLCFTAGEDR